VKQKTLESVRLDRWLNAARFFKTRSQAAQACNGRKVKVNGNTAKSHKLLKIGDQLTIFLHDEYRSLEIIGLAERGLPAKQAALLYNEQKAEDRFNPEDRDMIKLYEKANLIRPRYKGRPTKRERRKMIKEKVDFTREDS